MVEGENDDEEEEEYRGPERGKEDREDEEEEDEDTKAAATLDLTYMGLFKVEVVAIVVFRLLLLIVGRCVAKGAEVGGCIICFFMLLAVGAVTPPRAVASVLRPVVSLVVAGGAAAPVAVSVVPPFLLRL